MVGSVKQLLPALETRADLSRLQKLMGMCVLHWYSLRSKEGCEHLHIVVVILQVSTIIFHREGLLFTHPA